MTIIDIEVQKDTSYKMNTPFKSNLIHNLEDIYAEIVTCTWIPSPLASEIYSFAQRMFLYTVKH